MSWLSSALGSDAAQAQQAKATAIQKQATSLYGQYGQPQIQQNWAISQAMVPWLSALSTGNYANSGGGATGTTSAANAAPSALTALAGNGQGVIKYDPTLGTWYVHQSGDPRGKWGTYNQQTGGITWQTFKNPGNMALMEGLGSYSPSQGVNLGEVPQFMRVDVNNPYTPQELAGQQTLTDLGLSGYRGNLADVLSSSMARRGLSDSSAAITGSAGVEDAYQRQRSVEQAKLSQNLYTARQNARTEAAKNFYGVLAQITSDSGASNWASILSGQGQVAQGQANAAQSAYGENVAMLGKVLATVVAG